MGRVEVCLHIPVLTCLLSGPSVRWLLLPPSFCFGYCSKMVSKERKKEGLKSVEMKERHTCRIR